MGPESPLLWRGPEKGALTGIEGRESVLSCGRTGPAGTQQEMVPEVAVARGAPRTKSVLSPGRMFKVQSYSNQGQRSG